MSSRISRAQARVWATAMSISFSLAVIPRASADFSASPGYQNNTYSTSNNTVLSGFCPDAAGNVWMCDAYAGKLLRYANPVTGAKSSTTITSPSGGGAWAAGSQPRAVAVSPVSPYYVYVANDATHVDVFSNAGSYQPVNFAVSGIGQIEAMRISPDGRTLFVSGSANLTASVGGTPSASSRPVGVVRMMQLGLDGMTFQDFTPARYLAPRGTPATLSPTSGPFDPRNTLGQSRGIANGPNNTLWVAGLNDPGVVTGVAPGAYNLNVGFGDYATPLRLFARDASGNYLVTAEIPQDNKRYGLATDSSGNLFAASSVTTALSGNPTFDKSASHQFFVYQGLSKVGTVDTATNGSWFNLQYMDVGPVPGDSNNYNRPALLGQSSATGGYKGFKNWNVTGLPGVTNRTVSGTVLDAATGLGIAGATVYLYTQQITTGSDGSFTASVPDTASTVVSDPGYTLSLPDPYYVVSVDAPGYARTTLEPVRVKGGDLTNLNILMAPATPAQGPVFASVGDINAVTSTTAVDQEAGLSHAKVWDGDTTFVSVGAGTDNGWQTGGNTEVAAAAENVTGNSVPDTRIYFDVNDNWYKGDNVTPKPAYVTIVYRDDTGGSGSFLLQYDGTDGTGAVVLSASVSRTGDNGVHTARLYLPNANFANNLNEGTDLFVDENGSGALTVQSVTVGMPHLTFQAQPGGAKPGLTFGTQPVLAIADDTGAVLSGFTGSVTLSIKAGTGTTGAALSGTTTVTTVNGVATFSGLSIDQGGSNYVLTASSPGFGDANSSAFAVLVPPAVGTVTVAPSTLAAGRAGTVSVSATVTTGTLGLSSVTADLSAIGGPAAQPLAENAGTWSASSVSVTPPAAGAQTIAVTATDSSSNTASNSTTVAVVTPVSIGGVTFSPASVAAGATTTISVAVTPGTNSVAAVTADLSQIGGPSAQALSNSGGGNTYTFVTTVSPETPPGGKAISATATDAVDAFSATGGGSLTVAPLTTGSDIPGRFGPGALLATQTRPSGFGGSQLDQLFGLSDGGNLRLGITGNLQAQSGNNDGIVILLDTKYGGANTFGVSTSSGFSGRVTGLNGDVFDSGFNPDYAIDATNYNGTLYIDLYDLQTNGNAGSETPLGGVGDGAGPGVLNGGGDASFNNSNTAGAGYLPDALGNPASAATGVEISLPLSRIGSPSGPIKAMVLVTSNTGYHSNQCLPGLPDTYGNLAFGPQSFAAIPGRQYVTMAPAYSAGDLAKTETPWVFEDRVFTGNSALDNHPPMVSPPTIIDGRAYAVEDVEHSGGAHTGNLVAVKTTDGTLDTAFGVSGRVALDAPCSERPAFRSVGGVLRLYVVTDSGTLYSMDPDGSAASIRSMQPLQGVTHATSPAVIEDGGIAVAYYGVKSATGAYLVKVEDTVPPVTGSVILDGADDVSSSPSVVRGGSAIQIGTVNGASGNVLTVLRDLTVINMVSTAYPVRCSPTLSSDSRVFYVGDAPASGNGYFYCFNAGNGNPMGTFGTGGAIEIGGGLEYAAFGDYSAGNVTNALYFATSTGQVNAVDPATGSQLPGYPASPLGLESATGGVALLNGEIYVPTARGVFAVPAANPAGCARFPTSSQLSTPSAAGRAAHSAMAATGATGMLYGLYVQ